MVAPKRSRNPLRRAHSQLSIPTVSPVRPNVARFDMLVYHELKAIGFNESIVRKLINFFNHALILPGVLIFVSGPTSNVQLAKTEHNRPFSILFF
jgi:hypothetical protein